MIKILVVEDEISISHLIKLSLKRAGYACECAFDGEEAVEKLESERYDLVLLDVMLPKLDGFELMEYIRPMEIPVIFLTAKNSVNDRVKGLRMGAEDYIVKPFEVVELLARVEVVLRRRQLSEESMDLCGLHIDIRSMRVQRDGQEIPLTKKEFDLLLLFARNPNTALYRETIYERVWGGEFPLWQQSGGSSGAAAAEKGGMGPGVEGCEQGGDTDWRCRDEIQTEDHGVYAVPDECSIWSGRQRADSDFLPEQPGRGNRHGGKLLSDASVHAAGGGWNGSVCRYGKYAKRSPADDRAKGGLLGCRFTCLRRRGGIPAGGGSGGRTAEEWLSGKESMGAVKEQPSTEEEEGTGNCRVTFLRAGNGERYLRISGGFSIGAQTLSLDTVHDISELYENRARQQK